MGPLNPTLGTAREHPDFTAVLKAVLALEYWAIPPYTRSLPCNENIPFDEARLVVMLEATEWPHGRHERGSVNSFGVVGANAHVMIDSAASFHAPVWCQPRRRG